MLHGDARSKAPDQLSAIRHDEGLRDLLRIYWAEAARPEAAAPSLVPALLAAFLDLDTIRHDFPVLLVEDNAEMPIVALAALLDVVLEQIAADGAEGERLRRHVYRLETALKKLARRKPSRRLSELWALASNELLCQDEHPERLRASLDTAARALTHDGWLLGCGPRSTRRFFEHVWRLLEDERAAGERELLDKLIARVSEVLESEHARSPRSSSAEALEAALGGEHAGGIDFESLSQVLRSTLHGRPARRSKRLRVARRVLERTRAQLPMRGGNGAGRRRERRRASVCESCAEALDRFDAELQRGVELMRAVRVARLELDNRYREARHDRFFEAFDAAQLTLDEYRTLPPLLVYLDAERVGDADRAALVRILGSDMPVKVVLEVHDLPGEDPASAPPGTFTEWTRQIAGIGVSLGEAFVMQTAASHLPRLAQEVVDGLRGDGPALFCIYTPPGEPDAAVPHYLRSASAVESRLFPSFVYAPERGTDWASRFFLQASPQPEQDWPAHRFVYETADGQEASETLCFTCIDFLALQPRFLQQFVQVPRERWHANMMPVAEYLALGEEQALDKVPYAYLVDDKDGLHRVIVRRALLSLARKCLASWQRLQELAGINNSHALRLLERERARLAEQQAAAAAATPEPAPTADPATPAAPLPVPEAEATAAPSSDGEQAYIETELCTSCDDCIQRNPGMFAYNEAKQAYVKDPGAGSYRDLVEAAENCPVCIIHPGKPLHRDEPHLAELEKRAAAFN